MSNKIKVPADKSKTTNIGFRAAAWKKEALKQIADAKGTTMTNLFEEWLDQLIAGEGIEIEIEELKKKEL